VSIIDIHKLQNFTIANPSTGISVTLKRPIKNRPCIKLIVDGKTDAKHEFDGRQLNIVWNIEPTLCVSPKCAKSNFHI
jgi:hypothetical protein